MNARQKIIGKIAAGVGALALLAGGCTYAGRKLNTLLQNNNPASTLNAALFNHDSALYTQTLTARIQDVPKDSFSELALAVVDSDQLNQESVEYIFRATSGKVNPETGLEICQRIYERAGEEYQLDHLLDQLRPEYYDDVVFYIGKDVGEKIWEKIMSW